MPRYLLLALATAAFAIPSLVLNARQGPPPSAATGIVRGVVVREGTSEPIAGVQVTVGKLSDEAQSLRTMAQEARRRGNETVANLMDATLAQTFGPNVRGGVPQFTALTDSNGRFTIEGIPAGEYPLNAQREGYFGTSARPPAPFARRSVTVGPQQTTEVSLALIPGAAVSGRILDPRGAPAVGSQVEVFRRTYTNGAATLQLVAQKSTDDRGEYRHFQLPPDDYFVAAGAITRGARGGVTVSSDAPPRTFYPNTVDAASAQPVRLRPADDLTGINIQLQAVIGSKISGRVVSQLPAPGAIPPIAADFVALEGNFAALTLLPHDPSVLFDSRFMGGLRAQMVSPGNGAFEILNVPPGTYDIYASLPDPAGYGPTAPPGQAQQPVAYGRTTVDVRGADVNGVIIAVRSGFDISGRILIDGTATNHFDAVQVSLVPVDSAAGVNVYNQVARFYPDIASNGSFAIPAVPEAKYRDLATIDTVFSPADVGGNPEPQPPSRATPSQPRQLAPRNAHVADIRQGGASIYDDGISIGGNLQGPIEVLINTNGGEIQGTVVRANQQPVPVGTTVVLVPSQNRRQNPALYKTAATTNVQGTFRMRAIPPGLYKLFAWESIPAGAFQNADFMKQYEDRGVSTSISAGTTTSQTLTLIPAR
jgi:hypothetical protein